jgi:hypothetical protein
MCVRFWKPKLKNSILISPRITPEEEKPAFIEENV